MTSDQHGSLAQIHKTLSLQIEESPYDPIQWLARAHFYRQNQWHDLAAGDAYKVLLLADEFESDGNEYHEQVVEAIASSISEEKCAENFVLLLKCHAYEVLAACLAECGCLRESFDFSGKGLKTLEEAEICAEGLHVSRETLEKLGASYSRSNLESNSDIVAALKTSLLNSQDVCLASSNDGTEQSFDPKDLPSKGHARRSLYPWNTQEPQRYDPETIAALNTNLSTIAPLLEARATKLPILSGDKPKDDSEYSIQFGLFAREDLSPGQVILDEYSLLTANNRSTDPLCDVCSVEMTSQKQAIAADCCPDIVFCSERCHDRAMAEYHPATCDTGIESVGENAPDHDLVDMLYMKLMVRVFSMAETQDIHPLDLDEVRYLWGDFTEESHNLPFSFAFNILGPLNVLEKMNVDIFASFRRYDTWIFNTIYAKLRGVASGRVNPRTGKPETCAVHPYWCLANHSCDPNVKWDWGGEIKFFVRSPDDNPEWTKAESGLTKSTSLSSKGIAKDQEILNHYCDINLPLKERREWAAGALGGQCRCERCTWEES